MAPSVLLAADEAYRLPASQRAMMACSSSVKRKTSRAVLGINGLLCCQHRFGDASLCSAAIHLKSMVGAILGLLLTVGAALVGRMFPAAHQLQNLGPTILGGLAAVQACRPRRKSYWRNKIDGEQLCHPATEP
jgi:hypothetical protein